MAITLNLRMSAVIFIVTIISSCAVPVRDTVVLKPNYNDNFDIPPPQDNGEIVKIWATSYHLIAISKSSDVDAVPFRDKYGNPISDKVSKKNWCLGSQEASVKTTFNGKQVIIVHDGAGAKTDNYVDCTKALNDQNTKGYGLNYHRLSNAPYGVGVNEWFLVPYRTIAIPRKDKRTINIKYGDVIYIQQLKGKSVVKLPNGEVIKSDGYFFVGDTGSPDKIYGNHVDVFCGDYKTCYGKFTGGTQKNHIEYTAQKITDPQVISNMMQMHTKSGYY